MANLSEGLRPSFTTVDKMEILSSTNEPPDCNLSEPAVYNNASKCPADPVFVKALFSCLQDVCLKLLDFHTIVQISGCLFFQVDGAPVYNIDIYETVRKDDKLLKASANMEQVQNNESEFKLTAVSKNDAVKSPVPISCHLVNKIKNALSLQVLENSETLTKTCPQLSSKITGAQRRKFKQTRKLSIQNDSDDEKSGSDLTVCEGETVPSGDDSDATLSEGEIPLPESEDNKDSDYQPESPRHFAQSKKAEQEIKQNIVIEKQLPKKTTGNKVSKCNPRQTRLKKKLTKKQTRKEYTCNQCSFVCTALNKLLAHQKSSHGNGGLDCPDCGKTLSCSLALRRHHNSIHKGVRFPCDICERDFSSQYSLNQHKRGEHENNKRFKCKQCDTSFKFHHSLKLHVLKHSGARPYKCPHCNKTYLTSTHLKEHVTVVHAETRNHCCSTCGKRFGYLQSLREHEKIHTSERPHTCDVCQKGFISLSSLKTHVGTHVNSREFKCDECEKFYKTEILLKIHKRRHTQAVSRFMCDVCGLRFMFKSNLKMHAAVHSDIKQFRCKVCGKTFKTYPTLYSHVQIHNPENTFSCRICSKLFKTKARQSAHEKRHTEQKKHPCDYCLKLFSSKGDLGKHRRTVHSGDSRYSCPICGKVSARCDNIRGHLLRVHGKSSQEYSVEMLRVAPGPNDREIFNQTNSAMITTLQGTPEGMIHVPQLVPNQGESCDEPNFMPLMSIHRTAMSSETTGHTHGSDEVIAPQSASNHLNAPLPPPQHLKEGNQQYMRDVLRTYDTLMPIQPTGALNYGWSINHT